MIHVDGLFKNKEPEGVLKYVSIIGTPPNNNPDDARVLCRYPYDPEWVHSVRVKRFTGAVECLKVLKSIHERRSK